MAYSIKARELRRCKARKKDGQPCGAYARWGADDGLCSGHHFKERNFDIENRFRNWKTRNWVCTCIAYN